MNEILFFFKSLNGKGWFIPISEILRGTNYYEQAILLGDLRIFNLADTARLRNHQKLYESLSKLNLEEGKIKSLESFLLKKIENLEFYDKAQKWIVPSMFILGIFTFFTINYINDSKSDYSSKNQNSSSINNKESYSNSEHKSYNSSPSYNSPKTYTVSSEYAAFAKTESDYEKMMDAARLNEDRLISLMILNGQIKRFPAGKKVYLIDQGLSTIKIMDPDTGIYYFGTTESIK